MPVAGGEGVIARVSPDFTLGFNTSLTVYKARLSATFDWHKGGQILATSLPKSLTSSHLWDANDHPALPGHRGEKTFTTGGPGKEQGTNKLPPTRILQRSTRGQQEMGDCSPEVLATSSEQQRPSIVKTNSMLPKTNK